MTKSLCDEITGNCLLKQLLTAVSVKKTCRVSKLFSDSSSLTLKKHWHSFSVCCAVWLYFIFCMFQSVCNDSRLPVSIKREYVGFVLVCTPLLILLLEVRTF